MLLTSLFLGCVGAQGEKDAHPDTNADSGADSGEGDSPGETASTRDSSPDTESPPTDSEAPDPPDTGTVVLSSDDVASDGDCPSVEPICESGTCTLDAALTTVTLSGAFSPGSGWALRFTHPELDISNQNPIDGSGWGLYTALGSFAAWPTDTTYAMQAFTGTWDVSVERGSRGSTVEAHIPVASAVQVDADGTLDISADLHHVSGTITVEGVAVSDPGEVRLDDAATGAWAWTTAREGQFDLDVPDGTWTATFRPAGSADVATGTWSLEPIVVAGSDVTADRALDAQAVTGSLAIDGLPLDSFDKYTWTVEFVDEAGETWTWYSPGGGDVDTRLPPGRYTAVVENTWALSPEIVVDGGAEVDLANEGEISVTGTFVVEGGASAGWWLELLDPELGFGYSVGPGAWSLEVVPAVYDLYATHALGNSVVRTRIGEGVALAGPDVLDATLQLAHLDGTLTWGGGLPAGFEVHFFDESGAESMLYQGSGRSWDLDLPVGSYDVYVLQERDLVGAPALLARAWPVTGDTDVRLVVPTWPVNGAFTIDGAAETGAVFTHSEAIGDTFQSDVNGDGTWSDALPAGAYTMMAWSSTTSAGGTVGYVPFGVCVRVGE